MVNKYNEFILEKKIYSLILENNLKATADFKDKLFHIKNRSKIASILYKAFSDEEFIPSDLPQNWIDVTDKDDAITFIAVPIGVLPVSARRVMAATTSTNIVALY